MDIVSWTFANENYGQNIPIHIDCSEPTRCLSAQQTRTTVRQLVAGFNHRGLTKRDCVCVISFNDIYYTSLYLGIIGAGGCFTGANPGYTSYELIHHLRVTEAKFVIAHLGTLSTAITAADECGISRSNIFVFNARGEDVPAGHQSWTELLQSGEADWASVPDPDSTAAAYVSTSGTSGLPKAAILSHSYMVSQADILSRTLAASRKVSFLVALPPFHVFLIPIQHSMPLRTGCTSYVMPRYDPQSFVKAIEKFQISRTVMVPPILTSLSKSTFATKESLRSLRRILVGGSCAKAEMQQQLYKKLSPAARIEHVYGMTETGWAITTFRDRRRDLTGSVGTPLPGTELRLVDSDGTIVEEDEMLGEIHIRNPNLMRGYLNNKTATSEAFTADGWIRSGDVGYVKAGRWYVVDRTKDLIKVRGWQVSPAEIECALLEHQGIVDAAVIGVNALDDSGETPQAFVVRRAQSKVDEKDVKRFLDGRLARYKGVTKVEFVDSIPRNPTGKILRRILKDAAYQDSPRKIPDPETVLAYSKAISQLDQSRTNSSCQTCSHTRSTSNASTISTAGPATPPAVVETVLLWPKSKRRRIEDNLEEPHLSQKRRRSVRLVAIKEAYRTT